MDILKRVSVPTGDILIVSGEKGSLECISLGDYGKDANIKADFLGLTREINGVDSSIGIMPLSKKWVCTISTQYGCSMQCAFCDVPKVGPGINATFDDLVDQVLTVIDLHPEVKSTDRFNIHYARMGEPTFNFSVIDASYFLKGYLKDFNIHPVVSTMVPNNNSKVWDFIYNWMKFKSIVKGNAGLQISVNTTDEVYRKRIMPFATDLNTVSYNMNNIIQQTGVVGRKITLNIALTDADVDAKILRQLFNPKYFLIKITPMHETTACTKNNLHTTDGYTSYYSYKEIENELKKEGFEVIVFIPSKDEDESRITCGNAILSDRK
jgi:23S rRNA (adenine2503-C2)-methyltransferase